MKIKLCIAIILAIELIYYVYVLSRSFVCLQVYAWGKVYENLKGHHCGVIFQH